ncbi:MAG: GntR family transcriptional regulator [Verrucomicrobia bacterium]|nr:GntR family transcriptional regulator [Verrucomicrobiota bacterium]
MKRIFAFRSATETHCPPRPRGLLSRHRVRNRLQQMILNGEHAPGVKLVQLKLARQFGVSRGLVREALFEMKSLGLVETVDNRGAVVADVRGKRLLDCHDVREMLEGLAARLCCDRITRVQLRELGELAERVFKLSSSGKQEESAWLDREFHQRLIQISDNTVLVHLAEQHWVLGKIVTGKSGAPQRTREEHLAILKAIESGNEDEAERQARRHVHRGRCILQEQLAQGPLELRWLIGAPNGVRINANR